VLHQVAISPIDSIPGSGEPGRCRPPRPPASAAPRPAPWRPQNL